MLVGSPEANRPGPPTARWTRYDLPMLSCPADVDFLSESSVGLAEIVTKGSVSWALRQVPFPGGFLQDDSELMALVTSVPPSSLLQGDLSET
jgi:hypothetical protein